MYSNLIFGNKSLKNNSPKFKQDILLMAQLKVMNGEEITANQRFKKKTRINKRTFTQYATLSENVSQYVRNWSHSLRKRQKSSDNEWHNTARSW